MYSPIMLLFINTYQIFRLVSELEGDHYTNQVKDSDTKIKLLIHEIKVKDLLLLPLIFLTIDGNIYLFAYRIRKWMRTILMIVTIP